MFAGAGDIECGVEVFHALFAGQSRLCAGLADARECVDHRQAGEFGQGDADFLGLVEVAVAEALAVDGHRNERPSTGDGCGKAWIRKGLGGQAGEFACQVDLALVFQPVDQVERALVPNQRGSGEVERELETVAVRAGEIAVDGTIEHLAAGLAERFG